MNTYMHTYMHKVKIKSRGVLCDSQNDRSVLDGLKTAGREKTTLNEKNKMQVSIFMQRNGSKIN